MQTANFCYFANLNKQYVEYTFDLEDYRLCHSFIMKNAMFREIEPFILYGVIQDEESTPFTL